MQEPLTTTGDTRPGAAPIFADGDEKSKSDWPTWSSPTLTAVQGQVHEDGENAHGIAGFGNGQAVPTRDMSSGEEDPWTGALSTAAPRCWSR